MKTPEKKKAAPPQKSEPKKVVGTLALLEETLPYLNDLLNVTDGGHRIGREKRVRINELVAAIEQEIGPG